ncbi:hypothetical protein BV210_05410 [Halorientalis sp. IM1011]|uniref:carboxylate--amine ligase n=1 Tax=Halorientalis sp. IM1011 TaxID=1932360 RepID=UPI00097CC91E|nr:ATP-grasp domain-containing protein [Halorientalis sp. IM1011]AQL42182.1 hypothetical protein BV210_05410 [Halorientalis sp. IM1011]
MGRALVLSGETRHGLVAIRELARADVSVTAGSSSSISPARVSCYTDRFVRYPDPREDAARFVTTLTTELADRDYELLLPISGETVAPVVEHREVFEEYATVPFPRSDRFRVCNDKFRTMQAASEAGITCPRTVRPDEVGIDGAVEALEFPVIVKPQTGRSRNGVSLCESREELETAVERTRAAHGPVVVQSFVPNGGERGVYTIYDTDGELQGVTVQQRLRSNHPDGGPSTLRETVDDPALVAQTDRLLSALDWEGVAMAEYRIDAETGEPHLIEINPRLWGSLRLTIAAGVNVPVMLYRMASGESPEPALDYERGVRAHWVFGDAYQVLARENRLAAAATFCRTLARRYRRDILSVDDPLPAVAYGFGGLWRQLRT